MSTLTSAKAAEATSAKAAEAAPEAAALEAAKAALQPETTLEAPKVTTAEVVIDLGIQ